MPLQDQQHVYTKPVLPAEVHNSLMTLYVPTVSVAQVVQEAVLPADIMFSLRSPPHAGYLVMVSHGASAEEPPSLDPVQSFSQEEVNSGRVLYLHSRPGAWSDSFSLDAASGLGDPLEGIFVELEVLPTVIPLDVQNFSVPEGSARTLAPPLLQITGPYFPTLPGLALQVLEPPRHGALQKEDQPQDGSLSTFSWREVQLFQRHQGQPCPSDWHCSMLYVMSSSR